MIETLSSTPTPASRSTHARRSARASSSANVSRRSPQTMATRSGRSSATVRHARAKDRSVTSRLCFFFELFLAPPVPLQAAVERGEDRVVVPRESLVYSLLEQHAHDRVERLVLLGEVGARPVVGNRLEPGPAGCVRPQGLAHRVVAPRLERLHLGQPLPRLAHTAGAQPARDREVAVADETVSVGVAGVEDLDAGLDVFGLRAVGT